MALVTCKQMESKLSEKQGLLNDCNGSALSAGSRVVTCEHLHEELAKQKQHNASVEVLSAFGSEVGFIHWLYDHQR